MPAHHTVDADAQLLITTWKGEAHDHEFIEAIHNYQKEIQTHPEQLHFNEIVDFTDMTHVKLTAGGIKNIGRIALLTDTDHVKRKLALVVSSNVAFGLARMYTTYRTLSPKSNKDIHIFRTKADALEWAKNRTDVCS